jgi:hypothetical protein
MAVSLRTAWALAGSAAVLVASALIGVNSAGYLTSDESHPFLLERPELARDAMWRAFLATHVTGALACLATGPVLLWNLVLRRSPSLHRTLGRAYVAVVLGLAAPAGAALSFSAKGGFAGRAGFLVLAAAWFATTVLGLRAIRRRRLVPHARWMVRSYALAMSAIHFRAVQTALFAAGVSDAASYVAAIWLSLLMSVVQGEVLAAEVARRGRVESLLWPGGSDERDRARGGARRRGVLGVLRGTDARSDAASVADAVV